VSSINEALAFAFGERAKTHLQGIKSLLNDHKFGGFARDVFIDGVYAKSGSNSDLSFQIESDDLTA